MYVYHAMHFLLIDELLHIVKHFLGFLQLGVQGRTNQKSYYIQWGSLFQLSLSNYKYNYMSTHRILLWVFLALQ